MAFGKKRTDGVRAKQTRYKSFARDSERVHIWIGHFLSGERERDIKKLSPAKTAAQIQTDLRDLFQTTSSAFDIFYI